MQDALDHGLVNLAERLGDEGLQALDIGLRLGNAGNEGLGQLDDLTWRRPECEPEPGGSTSRGGDRWTRSIGGCLTFLIRVAQADLRALLYMRLSSAS